MVCTVRIYEKPKLNNPVLIEGLPGKGFVANIATSHLIHDLKAKLFGEILSASFQDLAVTTIASDLETLKDALSLGTKIMVGEIFGVAGLLIGLVEVKFYPQNQTNYKWHGAR
jgi:proteasome assembly chaperone (PAC2) family protein